MNTDLNDKIQGKLNQNRKNRNTKKALLVLSLAAVIFTSTVLANPASALTEDVSGGVVQGLENGGDSGSGAQAPVQAAVEQADAQGNEAAPSSDPQETVAAPSADQGVMNANSVSAVDSAAVTENGTGDSGIAVSGAEADGTKKSADQISAADGNGTAEQGATLAEAAETVSTEEAAAEKTTEKTEQAAQSETDVLSFADDRAQMKVTRKDGTGFPSDTTMSGSSLGTDDWNRVLSAVSSKVKAQSDDSTAYSVAGLHTWTLSLQAGDGSAASYDDIRAEAEFQGGLNDAGYATKTSEKEENGTDGTSTTTASYKTSWRVYAISGDSIADPVEDQLTDLTDADGTSLSVDENGALQSAAFDGNLPETVVFAQIVRETVTTGTEKKKEIPMPAVTFDKEAATDHGTITVHVEADEGTFEQGTTMSVKRVSSQDILDKAIEAAGGRGSAAAVDISFRKADGTETEPAKPIRVKMTAKVLSQADKVHVVHVDDTGNTDVVARKSDGKTIESTSSEAASSDAKNTVSFESDSFSVYAIVYTVDFETVDGGTYSIPGEGSYKLNDLLPYIIGKEGVVSDAALELIEGEDIAGALYLTQDEIDDWYINSDGAFTSTYLLTMTVDGNKYTIMVRDASSVDLTTISTIGVTCQESEDNTEVSRDASINFTMNYDITGANNINVARAAGEWVYDLSSMVGTDPNSPFKSLQSGDAGAIHDSLGRVVGNYQITDGKIILKITSVDFWVDPDSGAQKTEVSGHVSFNVQLNENHNYNKSTETISFPGNADVTLKYETKILQSNKGVGTSEGAYSQTNDSSEVQMIENADGTYTLYYEISATPNVNFKTLSVSDTLEGGQSLNPSSVQLSVDGGGWQNINVTSTGNGFTFDVAANQGGSVQGGKTYKIRYQTIVPKEQVVSKTVQSNRASWTWDLGTNQDNTSVKPKFEKKVDVGKSAGTVVGTYNLWNGSEAHVIENPDGSATIYYDVKVTSNTKDLSSLTVTDVMMGSGSVEVYKGTSHIGTATAANGKVDLLSFLNANGGIEPGAEYHLRYSTTIRPKVDGTFDPVNNKVHVEYDGTPKDNEITINPKIDKTITSGKTVKGTGSEQTSGDVTVKKNDNEDYYRLHYKITVKPGTGSSTLLVTDNISNGQEYISGSFYLGFNDEHNTWRSFEITPNVTGKSFSFDLAAFLASKGYTVTAQTTYQIIYDTKVADGQIGASQTNTSEWTWDYGKSGPDKTDVTPGVSDKIEKTAMHGNVNVGNDQQHLYVVPGDVVDFTVVVGLDEAGNPRNMAGRRIYDEISNYGTLEGNVTINPAVGETTVLGGSTLDGTADGSTKKVYDFTFPSEGDYTQANGYTITYHIKISENSDLTGRKQLLNKAFIDHIYKETKTPIEYGTAATTRKSFLEWDEDNQKIYWYIDVEIPEGKTLHNLYVTDYHMQYGTNANGDGWVENAENLFFDSSDITVSWLDASVAESAPSFTLKNDAATPNDNQVNNKGIFFAELSHSVRIRVATVSPVEFDSLTAYYAYNKAYVHSDEGEIGKPGAVTERYIATEYGFKKKGTFDQTNNVATWTVEINKSFLEVDPDFDPYFTDRIPENMELIDGTINVSAYINNIYSKQIDKPFEVSVVNNIIQPIYIGQKNQYEKFKLSNNYYIVTYKTRIKEEYLQQIRDADVLTEQSFTNFAKLQDENGNTKKTDDDTVEYKYENLIDKESGTLKLGEYIPYTITINPDSKSLNGGNPYTVSDVISTDVNLYIGKLDDNTTYPYVRDESGNDLLESGDASMSYNDDTRELSLTVPDRKKVTFVFVVNAIESGKQTFTNSVVLTANITDEDTVTKEYEIKKSEAGIDGVDLYVSLKKIDRNNPLKGLPGAKFKLVHVTTPGIPRKADGKPTTVTTNDDESGETQYYAGGDGTFGSEEEVGIYTVGASGGINFTNIQPYEVYYWIETEPAPGYIMTNTEKHYFVAYPIVRNQTEQTTENQHNVWAIDNTASAANGVTIVSARSGYSWNVTNLKEESVTGHFELVKTLQGRDMEADEFTFSVEPVSATVKRIIEDVETDVELAPADMPKPANNTVKNPAGTKDTQVGFAFGDIDFTTPGTYCYKIKEVVGENSLISYDQTEYTATVTIRRNSESGELENPIIAYTKADGSSVDKPAFVNTAKIDLKIIKIGENDQRLSGAKFQMTKKQNGSYSVFENESFEKDSTTQKNTGPFEVKNGEITISGLMAGDYMLSEIKAPDGYVITETAAIYFTIANGEVKYKKASGEVIEGQKTTLVEYKSADKAFEITNQPGAALPNTGGPGTRLFTILGSILILGAGVLLWRRRRLI